MSERDDDIREVMAEEQARGKRRIDPEARKAYHNLVRDVRHLLRIRDREEFIKNLIRLGVKPGSPEYDLALAAWREFGGV